MTNKLSRNILRKSFYFLFLFLCIAVTDKIYSKFEKFSFKDCTLILQKWMPCAFKASAIPGLIYEMAPGLKMTAQAIDVETNSMGIRDKEYSIKKPPNTFRIIILGDSVAYGLNLAYKDVFSTILENKLNDNKNGLKVEIINAAVPGYNTMQEYIAFINKWHVLNSDLVLVCFCWNDMTPAFVQMESRKGVIYAHLEHKLSQDKNLIKNITPEEMLSISMPNILYMPPLLHRQLIIHSSIYRTAAVKLYDFLSLRNKYKYPPQAYLNLVEHQTEYAAKSIKAYCTEHSIDLIFVLFPLLYDVIPQNAIDYVGKAKEMLANNSIKYVELKPYYKSQIDNLFKLSLDPKTSDNCHLNILGHKMTADALYDFLSSYLEDRYKGENVNN